MFRIHIYRLCNDKDYEMYIGSTRQKIKNRLWGHFTIANTGSKRLISKHIRDIGKDHFYIQVLQIKFVRNRVEQFKAEQRWKNIFNASLNVLNCYVTKEQKNERVKIYQIKNKEKIASRSKEQGPSYREKNKEVISERRKNYYQLNKEKEKSMHEEYVKNNRQKIRDYDNSWRIKNKDRLNDKRKVKITCECGSIIRKSDKSKHLKSNKHALYYSI